MGDGGWGMVWGLWDRLGRGGVGGRGRERKRG